MSYVLTKIVFKSNDSNLPLNYRLLPPTYRLKKKARFISLALSLVSIITISLLIQLGGRFANKS